MVLFSVVGDVLTGLRGGQLQPRRRAPGDRSVYGRQLADRRSTREECIWSFLDSPSAKE